MYNAILNTSCFTLVTRFLIYFYKINQIFTYIESGEISMISTDLTSCTMPDSINDLIAIKGGWTVEYPYVNINIKLIRTDPIIRVIIFSYDSKSNF